MIGNQAIDLISQEMGLTEAAARPPRFDFSLPTVRPPPPLSIQFPLPSLPAAAAACSFALLFSRRPMMFRQVTSIVTSGHKYLIMKERGHQIG